MEGFNDFNDLDLEELERDILLIKSSLLKMEKDVTEDIKNYFENIRWKVFLFNALFLIGFISVLFIDKTVSKFVVLLPVLNFVLMIYFDYGIFKNAQHISEIKQSNNLDLNAYHQRMNTSLLSYFSVISTFIISIVFVCLLFSITVN